jgi:8-hydroxy-5-deazaflavin:NADPH oxidoreductase
MSQMGTETLSDTTKGEVMGMIEGKAFGFIGAGSVAQTIAKHLLQHGHEVVLSNSRGADTLSELVASLGNAASAATPAEAAQQDYVVLSVMWPHVEAALSAISDWTGRILIDATNRYVSLNPLRLGDLSGLTSSEIVAKHAPGARVVKLFNTVPMAWIQDFSPTKPRTVLFMSGDDQQAKDELRAIVETIGFACIDVGSLAEGGRLQQLGGPLSALNLTLVEKLQL